MTDKTPNTYTIQRGDTLSELAVKFGIELDTLQTLNDIKDAGKIYAGKKLNLPEETTPVQKETAPQQNPHENTRLETIPTKSPREGLQPKIKTTLPPIKEHAQNAFGTPEKRASFDNQANPRPHIVLDGGHSVEIKGRDGKIRTDRGASVTGSDGKPFNETDVIDPFMKALKTKLEALGFGVSYTRQPGELLPNPEKDYEDSLVNRAHIANNAEGKSNNANNASGKIVISIHADSGDPSAKGTRFYTSAKTHNPDSVELAKSLAQNVSIGTNTPNVKKGNFAVLNTLEKTRPLNSPPLSTGEKPIEAATLVELGFLTNSNDLKELEKIATNPDKMAGLLATSVHNYVLERSPAVRLAEEREAKAQEEHIAQNDEDPNTSTNPIKISEATQDMTPKPPGDYVSSIQDSPTYGGFKPIWAL